MNTPLPSRPVSLELRQLRAFVLVAERGSVTRASEALCVPQPTISRHVMKLERALRTRLFVRERRGMQVTAQGERLLARARIVVAEADNLAAAAMGLPSRKRTT